MIQEVFKSKGQNFNDEKLLTEAPPFLKENCYIAKKIGLIVRAW